jgi:dipeptidyl aminopeptidase/acylaminoacyl peptidase
MLGDLYCLPAAEASTAAQGGEPVKARPVLLGVPHDTNPHFSPDGKLLAFSSDAGLGVENIWVTPWKGCAESDLRLTTRTKNSPHSWETKDNLLSKELMKALDKQEEEEKILAASGREDWIGRRNRLLREGRSEGMCSQLIARHVRLTPGSSHGH